jgi:nucleoside-diphosphate-sugar epimerase
MKKILLTGSTGFIGSHLLKELSKDNKIITIIRKKIKKNKKKNIIEISFKNYDELNLKLRKIKADIIIHCATHYIKNHTFKDIKKLVESNILFGNIILENVELMKVKKFINFSTIWENYNGEKENSFNLYAAYKKSFSTLIKYYEKRNPKINCYNLLISDTFGKADKRKKIINVIRENYSNNQTTTIVSKNLYLNLLNILDIVKAVKLIIKRKIRPGMYLLKNKNNFCINNVIKKFNRNAGKKIKIRWKSKRVINEKIFDIQKLRYWKPENSNIEQIIELIKT